MPDILGGLCSSSEEGTEAVPPRASSPPPVTSSPPGPGVGVGQPEALLAEHASAVWASPSPPPARPLAGSSRPSGPSPHDGAEASAQGAHPAACPGPFMSEFVWRAFVFVLFSPSSSVFVFCQVLMLRICCFAGGVMAGLLTPEEHAASASARFGPWQQGPLAPCPSECSLFIAYSFFCLLLLPTSNRPSDLSCYCCYFFFTQAPLTLLSQVGKSVILGFLKMSEVVSGSFCIHCEISFLTLRLCFCLFFE